MKAYVTVSYCDNNRGITNYTIFIQTAHGVKVDTIDIHESEFEEDNTLEKELECVKVYLKKKYKVAMSLTFVKASCDVIW